MAYEGKPYKALQALTQLHPFWAFLVLNMKSKKRDDIPTYGTDGKTVYYNPKFAESLSLEVNMFALAHEAGHPMFHHLNRIHTPRFGRSETYGVRDGKPLYYEPRLYNIAGDHVINLALKDCGFTIWKDCYCDPRFKGMTAEQVYNILEAEQPPPNSGKCNGNCKASSDPGDPSNGTCTCNQPAADKITGDDILSPAPDYDEQEVRETLQKAAAIARGHGKLPASLEALIAEASEPQYPVYLLLERFIDSNIRDYDHSFHIPNRRYLPYGVIQPSPYSDRISDVTVVYDTSGSVGDEALTRFHRITGDILRKLQPQVVRRIQCDAAVHEVREFKHLSDWDTGLKVTGRGGTSFTPPFSHLAEKGIRPSCLVYLTDLEGDFPQPPPYPVLWVSVNHRDVKAPFGTTITLNQ